ncbi:CHAT domain-containing protein [Mycena latifolia]|nr:CHAT domain-containing protein [Mycena latifolia]
MSKIIHLHSIRISLANPHNDLPADMQMFAQLIINGEIFLQTIPVESEAPQSSWKLYFGCSIPQYTLGFLVAILRHSKTRGTRLLVYAKIGRGEVLGLVEASHPFKIMLNRVNPDGPLLELSAGFTVSEGVALPLSGFYVNNIGENRITSVNNHGLTAELLSMKNESPMDPLQLWVLHERLVLLPPSNETRSRRLNILGDICLEWYTNTGTVDVDGLNQAVWVYTDAVRDDPIRFEQLGNLTDLNECMATFKAAVSLTSERHPGMPSHLNNLGNSLLTRFEQLGNLTDLNESVTTFKAAVSLTPEGHPDRPLCLNNLGNSLLSCFERLGDLTDLNESVSTFKAAVSLTPEGHPQMHSWLNNLGNSLLRRFERLGDLTDLNESVTTFKASVSLTPEGHPDMLACLNNLGGSLFRRFERLGELTDLNESVSTFKAAVSLTPEGHPEMPQYLHNLGNCLHLRFNTLKNPHDCEEMLLQYSCAASSLTGSAHVRFQASRRWAHYAHSYKDPSLLHAYTTAVELVPKVAWLGQLVRDAASAAIEAHEYSKAVEWLKQGRSVIWSQFLTLRTPVDDLHMVHPKLAAELVSISNLLETSGRRSGIEAASFGPSQSLQATAHQYHEHAVRRDKLLQQIRGLAGFEQFLLPKPIAELSAAATIGPVVLVNTSSYRSDALILIPGVGDEVMHVPLPDFTLDQMKIVKPALNGLALTNPSYEDPGRIWWCPTGPLAFLPIHAAGHYGQEAAFGSKLSAFLISSCTPSLSALINGFRAKQESQDGLQLLAVAQLSAIGQNPIPGTIKEIASIEQLAHGVIPVLRLERDMATVESVQKGMRESCWAHFACHGLQDIFTPTNSALLLAGSSKLTLSDIIQLQLPHADLAFLSACQTATGSKNLQDESVHLTAGNELLYCGFSMGFYTTF